MGKLEQEKLILWKGLSIQVLTLKEESFLGQWNKSSSTLSVANEEQHSWYEHLTYKYIMK